MADIDLLLIDSNDHTAMKILRGSKDEELKEKNLINTHLLTVEGVFRLVS